MADGADPDSDPDRSSGCSTSPAPSTSCSTSSPTCWRSQSLPARPPPRLPPLMAATDAPPARRDFRVRRPFPRTLRSARDPPRRARDARSALAAGRVRPVQAAGRRPHLRLAAHDDPDRGAHRDPRRARRRGALGGAATSSPRKTTPPRPWPSARRHRREPARRAGVRVEGRDARGVLVLHRAGPHVARRRRPEHDPRRRRRRHPARAQGRRVRGQGLGARPGRADNPELAIVLRLLAKGLRDDPQKWTRLAAGIKGVTEETTTGVHRLYQMHERGRAAVPGDQRQRLGHQVASSTTCTAAATASSTASTGPPT